MPGVNMDKKYKLTNERITVDGHILHRIKALRNFADVNREALGGYIEFENNLSHDGDCWVYPGARVYGKARIYDNANILPSAQVYGNAKVYENAWVSNDAQVYGNAKVYGDTWIQENAHAYANANIYGCSRLCGNAKVHGNAHITGSVWIDNGARIYGDAHVAGHVRIHNSRIYRDAHLCIFVPNIDDINDGDIQIAKLNHGVWNRKIVIGSKQYLISPTLETVLISGKLYE